MFRKIKLDEKTKEKLDNSFETSEIISDPKAMREISEGLEAYNTGKGKTLAQLKKELGV